MNEIQSVINERFLLQEEYLGEEKTVNKLSPLVSVTVATYQQVNFIKDCLDGILMQQVNFKYEIILGEDGSVDGTQEICKRYAEKYPDKIRLFIRDRSLSQHYDSNGEFVTRFNGIWNRMSARGKYIALCEGDDYWTDPLKLQKQVDFLEANPEYSLCSHRYKIYDEEKKTWNAGSGNLLFKKSIDGIEVDTKLNFTRCWLTQTMTVVYRKEALDTLLLSRYKYTCDAHHFYHILKSGRGYCMNYDAAVYRQHAGGVYSRTNVTKLYHNYNVYNELYRYNQDDDILKYKAIQITIYEHLFNKKYSIALAKDIIFVIRMTFHYAGFKKGIFTLLKIIIALFKLKLVWN
ncbi:MAG: glycosyltransferase [Bacteroidales bacterium]|jgi:glycosyltransferase involved in cell wall biosynthesis|nr:glycosyltransferase [Bacteroidales bacterium]